MVEDSRKSRTVNYNYGSVAYDFEKRYDNEQENARKKNKSIKIKNQKKFRTKAIGRVAVLFIMSLLVLYRFSYIITISNNISKIEANIKTVQNNNEDMMIKMAKKNNINDIENTATGKLGMIKASSNQIIIYNTNSVRK